MQYRQRSRLPRGRAIPRACREPLHNTNGNKTFAGLPDSFESDVLAVDTAKIGLKALLDMGMKLFRAMASSSCEFPFKNWFYPRSWNSSSRRRTSRLWTTQTDLIRLPTRLPKQLT
jgi:hypothetical protein